MASRPRRLPQVGDVYESRDRVYEPGRLIKVLELLPPNAPKAGVLAETLTNPRRTHTVGSQSMMSFDTIKKRWMFVRTDPVG